MTITRKPIDADVAGKRARGATDPNGPTGRLATWLANTTLDDIPPSVRERAKHLLLDGVACALVGAQLPVSRKGVEGVTALDDAGTSAPSAAMLSFKGSNSTITTRLPLCTRASIRTPRPVAASALGARGVAAEHHRVAARSRRRQRSPQARARLLKSPCRQP